MRRAGALLVVTLAACGFDAPRALDEPRPDATGSGAGSACTPFSAQLDTCALSFGPALALDGELTFDTGTRVLTRSGAPVDVRTATVGTRGGMVTVIAAEQITFAVGARLRAIGPHGLALVSRGALVMREDAIIDASAGGAGARAACGAVPTSGAPSNGGAGGGGGGGFGAAGGGGGRGNAGVALGGMGGVAVELPDGPLGGCPGAAGGLGADDGGAPGLGGGAVLLSSGTRIELAPASGITVGGGAGAGGTKMDSQFGDAGGGGGGSGGMIWLEAPMVRSAGTLAANGGGGGQGSGDGDPGRPGTAGALGVDEAPGGNGGSSTGSDGGGGGHAARPSGVTVSSTRAGGGGGGGGGVGFIHAASPDVMLGSVVSPPAQ